MSDPREVAASRICAKHRFRLGAAVGEGAFKRTYKVTAADGTPRALKVYKDCPDWKRAVREAEAARKCEHPCLAKLETFDVLAVGTDKNLYFVEEYFGGGTLGERLKAAPLTPGQARTVARELAGALEHLAARHLVHRDIKPDNIMFRDGSWSPALVDFGLVRDLSKSSVTQSFATMGPGTPFFAAPEQLVNDKHLIGWRTDQFSLGVTLALGLRGTHPYAEPGLNDFEVVEKVAARGNLTEEFCAWADAAGFPALRRMLHAWPVGRIPTPAQLIRAFE